MFDLSCLFTLLAASCVLASGQERSFGVDYENNCFVKNGVPFRYVSGSVHYFQSQPEQWPDLLGKVRYAGLNAVQTYIEWQYHELQAGVFHFSGSKNITRFILEAQAQGLLVILRPGPYICAERDMGGLPYWLLKQPDIVLRSSDARFVSAVDAWFDALFPVLKPLLYKNGGPVIMLQIENEYGSYHTCDFNYTTHMRDRYIQYFGDDVVLFTTDGGGDQYLKCGAIPGVLATIDFGTGENASETFQVVTRHRKHSPWVNSEFYSGWLDYWGHKHITTPTKDVAQSLDDMLALNASVNIYMFHGGTNFAYWAGSNNFGTFFSVPTSYDYDAPLTEAGDVTDKYFAIKKVVDKYLPRPAMDEPRLTSPKMQLPPIQLKPKCSIYDVLDEQVQSDQPLSFEELDHPFGYVLYSTTIQFRATDPAVLSIPGLRDRAHVLVDKKLVGTMSRTEKILSLPLLVSIDSTLDILVENQGRNSYGPLINEIKGIVSTVTLGKQNLTGWSMFPIKETNCRDGFTAGKTWIPSYYHARFILPEGPDYPSDTYLQPFGWTKGVAWVNGFNLGRYWPVVGPQITLFVPGVIFKPHPLVNEIVLFETERAPCGDPSQEGASCTIQFVSSPMINASVPVDYENNNDESFKLKFNQ